MARSPDRWARLFSVAGTVIRPLLRSRLHGLLSGQLMLLGYTGGRSRHRYCFPIGYFAWDGGTLLSFSSRRWPFALRAAVDIELLVRGSAHFATAVVVSGQQDKAVRLAEFARRKGARTAKRLMIGLPGDRLPSADEVATAAAATTIVRFDLDGGRTPSEAGTGEQTATSKERQ